jgi:hypothetical protein
MADITPTASNASEPTALTLPTRGRSLPAVERYSSHYIRYNGPIGRKGANQTTHTAEVRFPGAPGLAVVKAFPFRDKGWVNEALAWTLGMELDVGVPPTAILLAASPSDLAGATEPELVRARSQWGSAGPIILWCASRLDIKPPQHVWPVAWERAVMSKPFGRRLAAFDAWLGNCDRIAQNAPYWTTRGRLAAIDHERLAFNQDWLCGLPIHMDKSGAVMTHLMKEIREAINKKKIKAAEAKLLISELVQLSEGHSAALAAVRGASEQLVSQNFGATAAADLHTFLFERASCDFINERLEQLR